MSDGSEHLERLRRMCGMLPEIEEKLSHGSPTFFLRKKVCAMFWMNHHNDGHIAVVVPAAPGVQEAMISAWPDKFFRPAYVGYRGWVGINLDKIDDEELAVHLMDAWRLIAPKKLLATRSYE